MERLLVELIDKLHKAHGATLVSVVLYGSGALPDGRDAMSDFNVLCVLPIEFHDIRERHRVLYGEDLLAGVVVDDSFYRAQVEHELRAGMIRLRQKAGGVLTERDLLLRLMCESISTFCVLFRHALRLAGEEPVFGKREVVAAAGRRFGAAPEPFETLLGLREGKKKPKEVPDATALFTSYLQQIEVVVRAVDEIAK
jgi:hypothetical protein